jgi:flagellin-like hook-associated protein FlgL
LENGMVISVNTSQSTLQALQVLSANSRAGDAVRRRISTGLKVASAKDDGAIYAIAQRIRSDIASMTVLAESRQRLLGVLDVTLTGVESVQDQLIQLKKLATLAADPGLDATSRQALDEEFQAVKQQIDQISRNAGIFGQNLIDGRDSNFLTYGADPAKIGSPGRENWEPAPGETVDLTFTFRGGGKQGEQVDGQVAFYWQSRNAGGVWSAPALAGTTTIPAGTTLPSDGTPYTTDPVSFTAPDVAGARAYRVFAEWKGHWPAADDAQLFQDTYDEGKEHEILSWSESNSLHNAGGDWTSGGLRRDVWTVDGASIVAQPSTANQTDPGDPYSARLSIVEPEHGITSFGAAVDLYYEWTDPSGGVHRQFLQSQSHPDSPVDPSNTATLGYQSGTQYPDTGSIPVGPVVSAADFTFTGTIPSVAGPVASARIVADVTTRHNGESVAASPATQHLNNIDIAVTSVQRPEDAATGWRPDTFVEAIRGAGYPKVGTTIRMANPDPPVSTFDANASLYLEVYDGTSWQRMPQQLDSVAVTGGDAATLLDFALSGPLPTVTGPVEQARVVAESEATYVGVAQPVQTVTVLDWDGVSMTAQPTRSISLVSWNEAVTNAPRPRREEFATKVEWLDGPDGTTRPIRDSNLGTSGLAGLYLTDASVSSLPDARSALSAIQAALGKVNRQAAYYGAQYKRTQILLDMDGRMSDVLETGLGNLVDADMAKASAKLQAIQIKQQLGVQALSIANRSTGLISQLLQEPT